MKNILILGAGTGGTMVAHKLYRDLPANEWQITIVDKDPRHFYQPGFLFIPFGIYSPEEVVKPKEITLPEAVNYVIGDLERIYPEERSVSLTNGQKFAYDYLVIATGTDIAPGEVEGMLDGGKWHENIFDFYTIDGAVALGRFLDKWEGGKLVLNIAEMPIKCPIAPLEFLFLADDYFSKKGMRDKVELTLATPLDGAFTKPQAKAVLGNSLAERGIRVESDFSIMEVDNDAQLIRSYDEREISYDLLVAIPPNMGAEAIGDSGLGDDLNFVPTHPRTLQSKAYDNIFVIGDASNVPTSKAGSVVHFMLDTMVENLLNEIHGRPLIESFDGHANCFIESGRGKAYLLDFNYDTEPVPGSYPLPVVGPFKLLQETRMNHLGKMGFKWIYWNLLLKARPVPVTNEMPTAGKMLKPIPALS